MSANDYILINKKTFKVEHRDSDTHSVYEVVGKGKSLEEAIDLAEKYMQGVPVEYGIYFSPCD